MRDRDLILTQIWDYAHSFWACVYEIVTGVRVKHS